MDEWRQRVEAELKRQGVSLTEVRPLHGGACQDNYRVEGVGAEGERVRLALRSDARQGLPGSLDRAREFQVIGEAVKAGVPTPPAKWLTRGLIREGASAYFMPWVEGEAIGRKVVRDPELSGARAALPSQLAGALARLHSVRASDALPLEVPAGSPAQAALGTLRAMLEALPAPYPAVELGLRWLSRHAPAEEEVVLVHGDFRTGNFMVTPDGLAAVLDWEFAHLGSPYEDLGWVSVRDWRFGQLGRPIGGFAARAPFYEAYERASGRRVEVRQVLWWEIFGNLRWAVGSVAQGERYLSGLESDLELIAIARRSVEMEYEALRLIKRGAF